MKSLLAGVGLVALLLSPLFAHSAEARLVRYPPYHGGKGQSYWRKMYRGAYQTDVTVVDLKSKTFKEVTNFLGMDTWPMWGADGFIYFVSDRDEKAQSNIWRVPEAGGEATRITTFSDGD